jgi:hypothetical protein
MEYIFTLWLTKIVRTLENKNEQVKEHVMDGVCNKHGEKRNAYKESQKEKYQYENLYIDGRIILKCISEKENRVALTGLIWLRIKTSGELL